MPNVTIRLTRRIQHWLEPELFQPFVFGIFACLSLSEFVRGALVLSLLPTYGKSVLHFAVEWTALALSIHYLVDNVLRAPSGWLVDHVGERSVLLVGFIISTASVFWMMQARTVTSLILSLCGFGVGANAVWPAAMSGISYATPNTKRATFMSYLYIFWLLGAGSGPVIINFFIGGTYRIAFIFLLVIDSLGFLTTFGLVNRARTNRARVEGAATHTHHTQGTPGLPESESLGSQDPTPGRGIFGLREAYLVEAALEPVADVEQFFGSKPGTASKPGNVAKLATQSEFDTGTRPDTDTGSDTGMEPGTDGWSGTISQSGNVAKPSAFSNTSDMSNPSNASNPGNVAELGTQAEGDTQAGALLGLRSGSDWPALWRNIKEVSFLFPGMFAQTFAVASLVPILSVYASSVLHLSGAMYSLMLVSGGAITVTGLIPTGKFVDRVGPRMPLVISFLVAGTGLALFPLFRTTPYTFALVCLLGASYSFILPAWNAVLDRSIDEDKKGALWGVFMTVEGFGSAAGPYLGGLVWDHVGTSAPFWVSAIVILTMGLLYMVLPIDKRYRLPQLEV